MEGGGPKNLPQNLPVLRPWSAKQASKQGKQGLRRPLVSRAAQARKAHRPRAGSRAIPRHRGSKRDQGTEAPRRSCVSAVLVNCVDRQIETARRRHLFTYLAFELLCL